MDRDLRAMLEAWPAEVQERALAVDQVLIERVAGLSREIDPKGGMIGYMLGPGYKGTLWTILLSKAGVKVGFAYGASLPDPEGLLAGRGKVHRYVPISSVDDLRNPAFLELLDAAFERFDLVKPLEP